MSLGHAHIGINGPAEPQVPDDDEGYIHVNAGDGGNAHVNIPEIETRCRVSPWIVVFMFISALILGIIGLLVGIAGFTTGMAIGSSVGVVVGTLIGLLLYYFLIDKCKLRCNNYHPVE